ncbi:MAG: c-type cytochrome [Brachymonas sp.]
MSQLMHCLPYPAGFALSPSLRVMALSAFFAAGVHAQTMPAASPSADRGLAIYTAKCSACHSVDEHRVGPAHVGVFGRRAGKAKDYEYSEALSKSKIVWNRTTLQAWLTNPEQVIPGQRMGYRLSLPQERADVVAYLATLRNSSPQNNK